MKKRTYRLKRRAARQQRTRDRIVEAAMSLHEEVGPAATTISALAERAGVQRLTVYRHFATEQEIFRACSTRWFSLHPPPDLTAVRNEDPVDHTRLILRALYGYYRDTQTMWISLYRDYGKVAALDEPMALFEGYLSGAGKIILAEWAPCRSKQLRATIGHVLCFTTWQTLAAQGLGRTAMSKLASSWIAVAAGRSK